MTQQCVHIDELHLCKEVSHKLISNVVAQDLKRLNPIVCQWPCFTIELQR